MNAILVWDGENFTMPPAELVGTPRPDQMQGSSLDRIVELAGRTCYDSCGTGRPSAGPNGYHAHISQVKHGSVWEHATLTFESVVMFSGQVGVFAQILINRPSAWFSIHDDGESYRIRFTVNARHAMEWHRLPVPSTVTREAGHVGDVVRAAFRQAMPLTFAGEEVTSRDAYADDPKVATPETDEEIWACLYWDGGSRGLSHELVRHGDFTAISQRSSRFCDESESPWIPHPLLESDEEFMADFRKVEDYCKAKYDWIVPLLQDRLTARGLDKTTARKQARGAMRGVLGNALETKMVFSASLAQWKHILTQRASDPADAEIRKMAAEHFWPALKARWPERFEGWEEIRSSDGLTAALRPPVVA